MDILTRETIDHLIDIEQPLCVSIYLPTHHMGTDMQQDPIRLKNMLHKAEDQLSAQGIKLSGAHHMLEPAWELLHDLNFWQHLSDGLAIFLSDKGFYCYRLPLNFTELLVVADHFHVKSLLPLFIGDGQFFVLALSQNHIRLLHGTRYSINVVDIRHVPGSLAEALRNDDNEDHIQMHTSSMAGSSSGRSPIIHGYGGGSENAKNDLLRFFQLVDKGLNELIKGIGPPLILAGVEYLLPIYKDANTYPHLIDAVIKGNPDLLSSEKLHRSAWDFIGPIFMKAQEDEIMRFRQLSGQDSSIYSDTFEEIIPAAFTGRVEVLLIANGTNQWGKYNRNTGIVHLHEKEVPGDEDLLDVAAVFTFLKGGKVYLLEQSNIPNKRPVAAVFRFN